MRIAMLLPIAWSKISYHTTIVRKVISHLVAGLTSKGVTVTVFSVDSDRELKNGAPITMKAQECLYITKIFEQEKDFDLIHNHSDYLPLTYSSFITTPVLTTIYEPLVSGTLPVYKKYNKRTFYVNDKSVDKSPEISYIAEIDHGIAEGNIAYERLLEEYIRVYKSVIEIRQRKDRRPWGHYTVLSDTDEQKSKLVNVFPGTRLSLQRHKHRHEHWHIVKGEALVTINDREFALKAGDSIEIPRGAVHRIANCGKDVMTFFEVQSGDYLGEDDIERLEDDYART